ncbi:MAG: hydrogenase subunit MbhD domain-containing protein [Aquificaceae bacterium]
MQDVFLSALLVILALLSLFVKNPQLSVIAFGLFGSVLAIIWLRLLAPDVALVELLLGAGVLSALMMRLSSIKRAFSESFETVRILKATSVSLIFLLWMIFPTLDAPQIQRIKPLVFENLKISGVESPLTAVLLNFRGYDTLLEVLVITIAVIGVLDLNYKQPEILLKNQFERSLASIITPFAVFFSFYITYLGFSSVGGAFQGGVLLAGAFILMSMVEKKPKKIGITAGIIGLAVFTLVFLLTSPYGKGFLYLRGEVASYIIMLIELGILISTGALLFFAFRGKI